MYFVGCGCSLCKCGAFRACGGAFDFFTGKTGKNDNLEIVPELEDFISVRKTENVKLHGLGFDIGLTYDLNKRFLIYADFGMTFPREVKELYDDEEFVANKSNGGVEVHIEGIDVTATVEKFSIIKLNIRAGVAYKFNFDVPFDLSVGVGLAFSRLVCDSKVDFYFGSISQRATANIFGVGVYLNAGYRINEKLSLGVTVMPDIQIYSIMINNVSSYALGFTSAGSLKTFGFAFGFNLTASVGLTYKF